MSGSKDLKKLDAIFEYEQAQSSSGPATKFPEKSKDAGREASTTNKSKNLAMKERNDEWEKEVLNLRRRPISKDRYGNDLVSHWPKSGPLLEAGEVTSAGSPAFYHNEDIRGKILQNALRYEKSLRKMPYDDGYV